MSVTRIKRAGQPLVTPASDGRLTISVPIQIKRAQRAEAGNPAEHGNGETPTVGEPTPLQLALPCGYRWLSV